MFPIQNRKCSMCGVTQIEDRTVPYFYFPQPGKNNILRARAWAKYCWPSRDWVSVAQLIKLGRSHRLLCGRHFEANCFSEKNPKKLKQDALPGNKKYLERVVPKLRSESHLMKNDANVQGWSSFLLQSAHIQEHNYVPLYELLNKIKATRRSNPTAAVTVAQPTNVEENHEIYAVQTPSIVTQPTTKQNNPVDHQLGCDASDDKQNYNNESLVPVDDEAGVTLKDNDDRTIDVVASRLDIPEKGNNEPSIAVDDEDGATLIDNDDEHTMDRVASRLDIAVNVNDEWLTTVDDEDGVTLIENDDDDIMDMVASTLDIADNPDFNEEEEHYVPQEHQGFRCNVCLGKIVGFRYRCCECEDYDMCSACESRGEHPLHYVLRVPGNRKQCEIRSVMAAINVALRLPEDVKDELVIKVEDAVEEPPPDPLDTGEVNRATPEPMETDTYPDPEDTLISFEGTAPSPAKKPREILLAKRSDLPVVLDALHRKAVVRLEKMSSIPAPNVSSRAPLLNRVPVNESKIHPDRTIIRNNEESPHGPAQNRQTPKRVNIPSILRHKPRKQSFTSNKQCNRPIQPLSSSQSMEEKTVITENVATNRDNSLNKEPTDGSSVANGENNLLKKRIDGSGVPNKKNTLAKKRIGGSSVPNKKYVLVKETADGSRIIVPNRKYMLVKETTDGSSVPNRQNVLVKESTDDSSVPSREFILVEGPTDGSSVPSRENIFVKESTNGSCSVPSRKNILVKEQTDGSSVSNRDKTSLKEPTESSIVPNTNNIFVQKPTDGSSVPNRDNILVQIPTDGSSVPNRDNNLIKGPTDGSSVPNTNNILFQIPTDGSSITNTNEVFTISEEDFKALMAGSNINDMVIYEAANMAAPSSQQDYVNYCADTNN